MRIFLTGATGFIGTAVVRELTQASHHVTGLARSDVGAQALQSAGATVHRGSLEDLDSLRRGAEPADAVIHTAFDHEFIRFAENCEKDARAIKALGDALRGSVRPLVITSGTGIGSVDGAMAREDVFNDHSPNPRVASERAANALLQAGVNVSVMRLPQVHNALRQGLVTYLVAIARGKGVAAYVGDGLNRWAAGHLTDVARLFRLAVEKGEQGARWHAVREEGVTSRAIAEQIGQSLHVPVISISSDEAQEHFGWMASFTAMDMPASSAFTQARLMWRPVGPTLLEDLTLIQ